MDPGKPAPIQDSSTAAETMPTEKIHDVDCEGDCKEGHVEVMFQYIAGPRIRVTRDF